MVSHRQTKGKEMKINKNEYNCLQRFGFTIIVVYLPWIAFATSTCAVSFFVSVVRGLRVIFSPFSIGIYGIRWTWTVSWQAWYWMRKIIYKQIDALHTHNTHRVVSVRACAPDSVSIAKWTRLKCSCRSKLFSAIHFFLHITCVSNFHFVFVHIYFVYCSFEMFFSFYVKRARMRSPNEGERERE